MTYDSGNMYTQPPTNGTATASLILSILGLIGILPIIGSIIGIILGNNAKKEILASNGTMGGEELAKWGVILGWVGLGIFVLAICCAGAAILISLFAGGLDMLDMSMLPAVFC